MKLQDDFLKQLILDIESFSVFTEVKNTVNQQIELWPDPLLLSNLSGWVGALVVRTILSKLAVNEHHVFRWRLENKYIQYLLLDFYIPGCMPETIGLSKVLDKVGGELIVRKLFKKGFFLKAALGHGSFNTKSFDRTAEFDDILSFHQETKADHEKWILQKKLNLDKEFRVHTFDKEVISGLTFKIQGIDSAGSTEAEEFVKGLLEKLPDTIFQGTLIGWDIGLTDQHRYYVIEANFTGFHPEYCAGFQTSGYVEDNNFGPIVCAWLNQYFNYKFRVAIVSVDDSMLSYFPFLSAFMFYSSIFNNNHIAILNRKVKAERTAIIYFPDMTNTLMMKLITFFQVVNFAEYYYVITKERFVKVTCSLFLGNDHIKVWAEESLFKKDQYPIIEQFREERRKQICCYHAVRQLHPVEYIII
ncbi:hypothetical protein [Pedobacter sp. L105]|uniref:hypothetical protein n=1 Tax=Pedobacter sp. L105 TaxID=1641871 RepID=UPI00131B7D1B|nr:hypothetical protein [Pedobacter sp. L105]